MKRAVDLQNLQEVIAYWRECLGLLDQGYPDQQVAALMVNVINNDHDEAWNSGPISHPAYSLVFELAGSLELPEDMTVQRPERWHCIRALIDVIEADRHDDDAAGKTIHD